MLDWRLSPLAVFGGTPVRRATGDAAAARADPFGIGSNQTRQPSRCELVHSVDLPEILG